MKRYKIYKTGDNYYMVEQLRKVTEGCRGCNYYPTDRKFKTLEDTYKFIDELEAERLSKIKEKKQRKKW